MAQTAFCDGHKNAKTSSSPLLPTSYQRRKERGVEWAKEREIQRSILVSPFFSLSKCPHFDHLKSKQATFMCAPLYFLLFFWLRVSVEQTLAAISTWAWNFATCLRHLLGIFTTITDGQKTDHKSQGAQEPRLQTPPPVPCVFFWFWFWFRFKAKTQSQIKK